MYPLVRERGDDGHTVDGAFGFIQSMYRSRPVTLPSSARSRRRLPSEIDPVRSQKKIAPGTYIRGVSTFANAGSALCGADGDELTERRFGLAVAP